MTRIREVEIVDRIIGSPLSITESGKIKIESIGSITGPISLPDGAATESTLSSIDGKDFATETTLSSINAKDFATETTLTDINTKLTNGSQLTKLTDGTNEVDVNQDNDGDYRLAVECIRKRKSQPVREYDSYSTNNTKASYTVPSGKVLYVVYAWISYGDEASGEIVCELQDNGTGVSSMAIERGGGVCQAALGPIESVPFGPFNAGDTVRIQRVDGDNDDWAGGWHGFLEDI